MKWFRFYDEALDDPKVQRLPGDLFKLWVNLLCLASKNDERGVLPGSVEDIAWRLRVDIDWLRASIHTLQGQGLLDWVDDEKQYQPHNWQGRQYPSDDVTARVNKHRQSKAVAPADSETLHETFHVTKGNVLDSDTDKIQSQSREEERGEGATKAAPIPIPPQKQSIQTSYPDTFTVTEDMRAKVRTKYPDLDIDAATEEWAGAMCSNRTKYRYTDWPQAWYGAMRRANEWGTSAKGSTNGSYKQGNIEGARPAQAGESNARDRQRIEGLRSLVARNTSEPGKT